MRRRRGGEVGRRRRREGEVGRRRRRKGERGTERGSTPPTSQFASHTGRSGGLAGGSKTRDDPESSIGASALRLLMDPEMLQRLPSPPPPVEGRRV